MNINKISAISSSAIMFGAKTKIRNKKQQQETKTIQTPYRNHGKTQEKLKIDDYAFEAALIINLVVNNARERGITIEEEFRRFKAAMTLAKKAIYNDNEMLTYSSKV